MDHNQALIVKLEQLENRYVEIDAMLSDQEIVSNHAKMVPLSKEQGKLRPMVEKLRRYKEMVRQAQDSRVMAADKTADAELREMASAEVKELTEQSDTLLEEIKNKLVMAEDDVIR
jgi:peptide chain release factor 1